MTEPMQYLLVLALMVAGMTATAWYGARIKQKEPTPKEAFDRAYEAWRKRVEESELDYRTRSNPKYFVGVPEFRAIVRLGEPALPYIMRELMQGEFWLNHAMERITGLRPPTSEVGETAKSYWWTKWWLARRK